MTLTISPNSVDELRDQLTAWFSQSPKSVNSSFRFQRISPQEGQVVIRSVPLRGIRFRWNPDNLVFEERHRKVNLRLEGFEVNTEIQPTKILITFKRGHAAASRPLRHAISSLGRTQNPAFVSRALQAVVNLERELPEEALEEATSAPNDILVLLNAIKTPSVVTQLAETDPLASAKLRGVEAQQKLLKTGGGALSAEETGELLGISRQAVDKRRRQGQVLGLAQGRRGYAYPAWQFEKGRALSNLGSVLEILRKHDPWMQLAFFLNPNHRLGGASPVDVLRAGDVERVISAAQAYGELGAA